MLHIALAEPYLVISVIKAICSAIYVQKEPNETCSSNFNSAVILNTAPDTVAVFCLIYLVGAI